MKNTAEQARLEFLVMRDGLFRTREFAERVYRTYRQCLRTKRGFAGDIIGRRGYVESCLSFREFLRETK